MITHMLQLCPIARLSLHFRVGTRGEDIAARYLLSLGYRVLERNVRIARD